MYVVLCLGVGFVYFQLGDTWLDTYSRAALLFFVVAFLTFMAIAAFPSFIEDLKVGLGVLGVGGRLGMQIAAQRRAPRRWHSLIH